MLPVLSANIFFETWQVIVRMPIRKDTPLISLNLAAILGTVNRAQLRKQIRTTYNVYPWALHITRIENLTPIFSSGSLKCRNHPDLKDFVDISEESVQKRRKEKIILDTGKTLFDYVPFFLTYKAPMVSAKRTANNDLVYLQINLDIFAQIPGCILSDGNAANTETKFVKFDTTEALKILDLDVLYKLTYKDDEERKRKKAAELLVPCEVPVSEIWQLAFYSNEGQQKGLALLEKIGKKCASKVAPKWFYE